MSKLSILPNELQKDQSTQNQQVFMALNDTLSWSNKILSQRLIDFTDTATSTAYTATSYQDMFGYSFQFSNTNPLCILVFNINLSGSGSIGLFVGDQLLREIPFNFGSNQTYMSITNMEQFAVGSNNLSIKIKASTGTVTKNAGFNTVQLLCVNS